MKKLFSILLAIILLCTSVWAYFPISRVRNFVNDKNNGIPITASYMDAELNQLILAVNSNGIVQGSAPTSPTNGLLWFDTTNNVLKVFRFNEWVQMNPVHAGSIMATAQNNDLWINAVNGMNHLKMFDNNVNGGNWEDIPGIKNLKSNTFPWFDGVNWNQAFINKGINWPSVGTPTLFNGINWDDPSYLPAPNKYWQYQSFGNIPLWSKVIVPSNVLFQYQGQTDAEGTTGGEFAGTSIKVTTGSFNYRYLVANGPTSATTPSWSTKYTHLTGVSTITVYARIWSQANDVSQVASIQVSVGGQTGSASGSANTNTPQWVSFTINVSTLTPGTTYDVIAYLYDNEARYNYCSNIIGFAS